MRPRAVTRRSARWTGYIRGDRLVAADSELAVGMTVRHDGVDVPMARLYVKCFSGRNGPAGGVCPWSVRDRFGVVALGTQTARTGAFNFGGRVAKMGFTPLYVRYNSGLHISDNGAPPVVAARRT